MKIVWETEKLKPAEFAAEGVDTFQIIGKVDADSPNILRVVSVWKDSSTVVHKCPTCGR